jgi:hypothetical protein
MNFILLAFKEIKSSIKMSNAIENQMYLCPVCRVKSYKHMPSLSRHKKTCTGENKVIKVKTIKVKKVKTIEEKPVIIVIDNEEKKEKEDTTIRKELDNLWMLINKEKEERKLESAKMKKYLCKVRKDHLFQETKMKQHIDRLVTHNKQLMFAVKLLSQVDSEIDAIDRDNVEVVEVQPVDIEVVDVQPVDVEVIEVQPVDVEVIEDTEEVPLNPHKKFIELETECTEEVPVSPYKMFIDKASQPTEASLVDIPHLHMAISDGEIKMSYQPIIIFEEGSPPDSIDFYSDTLEFRKSFYNEKTQEFDIEKAELFVFTYINQLKAEGLSIDACASKLASCYPISLLSIKKVITTLFSVYSDSYRYVETDNQKDPWSFYDENFKLEDRMFAVSLTIQRLFEQGFRSIFQTIYSTMMDDASCIHIQTIESNMDLHNLLFNIRSISDHVSFVKLIQDSVIEVNSIDGFDNNPYNIKKHCVVDEKEFEVWRKSVDTDQNFQHNMKTVFQTLDYADIEERIDRLFG